MVRFKVGPTSSVNESPDGEPLPFALEVDGVDLLAGAGEEPPARVLPELLEVLGALHRGRTRCGQLSLPESKLELCLYRLDSQDVEVSVVRFARPIQLQARLVLELAALTQAARECALAWKVSALAHSKGPLLGRQALTAGLKKIEGPQAALKNPPRPPFSFARDTAEPVRLSIHLDDPLGRRFAWDRRAKAHLPPLLMPGALAIGTRPANPQPPLLTLLDLTREASGESGAAAFDTPTRVALFETALELTAALIADHPGLSKNPYLEVLQERSQTELALLAPAPGPGPRPSSPGKARKKRSEPSLSAGRALRRLRFVLEWEKPAEWGDGSAKLLLSNKGVIVAGTHVALGYGPQGDVRFRRMGTHGVASCAEGVVVTASAGRLLCFGEGGSSARWLKDHDGTVIGPELNKAGSQLLVRWGNRGVASFDEVTGRELWRVDPPRARVTGFSVEGERALLPTDAGLLVAVNLADGVPGFRMRATYPLPHRLVRMKNRYLGVLAQGTGSALFAVDLDAAAISWTRELNFASPSEPLPHKGRIYVAGERDGRGVLTLLDGQGVVLWEKPLPLLRGRYALAPAGPGVLVQDGFGSAALVVRDGEVDWRVGGASAVMSTPVAPHVARGVAVLPGEVTRVVDLKSGRPLTDLPMRNLMDLRVDRRLKLYALEDHSTLRALALTAQLSVV